MKNREVEKEKLRKEALRIRKYINNKKEKEKIITKKVIDLPEYRQAKTIAIYKSMHKEVSTDELIEYSLNNKKIVALPKVVFENLEFYKINSINDLLIKSNFGVEEPIEKIENFVNKKDIDLVIVPGLCFDREGNRLGFGKGYYDRFLEDSNLKTLALCFSDQLLQEKQIPITENDISMQQIVTDKEVINLIKKRKI